jgi:hypothetical protein
MPSESRPSERECFQGFQAVASTENEMLDGVSPQAWLLYGPDGSLDFSQADLRRGDKMPVSLPVLVASARLLPGG